MVAVWARGILFSYLVHIQSGGINLQTVRHEEGKVLHCLKKHTSAVSVLRLGQDEQSVLSGGWDRQVYVNAILFGAIDFDRNGI